ncbi:hypothetical protein ALC62_15438 [Cyphomyrmex costatus]|uniref:CCHC-type domain-containing protein n=1 Tax=Cyphomyrmex costatus TaxID=456900 RepID=A0A151I702_9HYME|nr:hypothetical protein ALC62_15438 [Cyphomyrmex costatus]
MQEEGNRKEESGRNNVPNSRRRMARNPAVMIEISEGGPTYTEVLRKARERIPLGELQIKEINVRRTQRGAMIIQVTAERAREKAKKLTERLKELFDRETKVKIYSPSPQGEIKLMGLDESLTVEEISGAVAKVGKVERNEVKVGRKIWTRDGTVNTWVRCPLDGAIELADAGRIRIGWSSARTMLMKKRPPKCYKCLAVGHTRIFCPSEVDRTGACFNCGKMGHTVGECKDPPRCPLCLDSVRDHRHRPENPPCPLVAGGQMRKETPIRDKEATKTRGERMEMETDRGLEAVKMREN